MGCGPWGRRVGQTERLKKNSQVKTRVGLVLPPYEGPGNTALERVTPQTLVG